MTAKLVRRGCDEGLRPAATLTLVSMGFNPFRRQRRTTVDVVIVVAFALVTLAFVAWGFFG